MTREDPAFKIKTGNLPVLLLHILTNDMDRLEAHLSQRLAQTPDFFASTPIVLELSAIAQSDADLDFMELVSFMREVASGNIQPLDAVKAYHASLKKSGLTAIRELAADSEITEKVLKAG